MKLQNEYPNYQQAISYLIDDKNPVQACNDSKQLCYYIPLSNHKSGYDYYEFNRTSDGGVYFSIYTLLELKTVVKTNSFPINGDLSKHAWIDIISDITLSHFNKEEYVALKHKYIKKESGGCAGSIALFFIITLCLAYSFL